MRRGSAAEKRWFAAVASVEQCVLCGQYGVQVAHRNEGRGLGQKSLPCNTAALCPSCHHEIDNGRHLTREERRAMMDRAIVLTHEAMAKSGRLEVRG